jgi:hypothetical protein
LPFPVTVSPPEPELCDEELELPDDELDVDVDVDVGELVGSGSPSAPETKEQACSTIPATRHCRMVRSGRFISPLYDFPEVP